MAAPSTSEPPVVLITGAASGIGRATACRFAQEGWNLALADIATFQDDDLLSIRQRAKCLELPMDVTSAESVSAGVKLCTDTYGRLDVLVNCAGKSLGPSDILDIDEDTWDANAALNLKSFYLVTRAALPLLLQRQTSAIVNVTSVNGLSGIGEYAYSAQKAGVINLTENLAVKYGAKGLRVNCVAPGTIRTAIWDERLRDNPETLHNLAKYYPLGRLGEPEEVANAIFFFASPQAAFITGQCLKVDGGLLAGNLGLQKDLMGS